MRSLLEPAASGSTPARRLRVLEIGAGIGGTTAAVLPALLPDRTGTALRICRSSSCCARGSLRRRTRSSRYALDIEQDPAAQGTLAHSFDVIVATHVLHATRNLRETLTHCRSLLAPGGVLLLNELTDHPGWFDSG